MRGGGRIVLSWVLMVVSLSAQGRLAVRGANAGGYACNEPGRAEAISRKAPGHNPSDVLSLLTISEDGRPQQILSGVAEGCGAEQGTAPVVALLFDRTMYLPGGGLDRNGESLRAKVESYLRKLPTEAAVAVYSYGPGAEEGFDVLREQMAGDDGGVLVIRKTDQDLKMALAKFDRPPMLNTHAVVQMSISGERARSLAVIQDIANHWAGKPGRKALVWVAPWFWTEAEPGDSGGGALWLSAMAALERADMAIYPVTGHVENQGFERWAEFTGGRAFHGAEDFPKAVEAAEADCGCYAVMTWERRCTGEAGVHPLALAKIGRKSSDLLFRKYLFDAPRLVSLRARLEMVETAFETPLDGKALDFAARVVGGTSDSLQVQLGFNAEQLAPVRTGVESRLLDVVFAYFGSRGERIPTGSRAEISLPAVKSGSRQVRQTIPLPSGAARLRVAIRDAGSGAMASRTISLR
jgi:hypothetical protein